MMLFHLATPYLALSPNMAASVLRNRVLVSAHAWLYFLNLSRFSVDRRGHFRAVGETTTADLVTYKQKQRAAAEEAKAKAVRLCLLQYRRLDIKMILCLYLCTHTLAPMPR
jgi:hypothetical protein